jgi:hypothetical protein
MSRAAPQQQQPAECQGVGVDDPGEIGGGKAQPALDVWQGDVHDRPVQDEHQLAGDDHGQGQGAAVPPPPAVLWPADGEPRSALDLEGANGRFRHAERAPSALSAAMTAMHAAGAALPTRAQRAGSVRVDLDVSTVLKHVCAVGVASEQAPDRVVQGERLLGIVLDGLRVQPTEMASSRAENRH